MSSPTLYVQRDSNTSLWTIERDPVIPASFTKEGKRQPRSSWLRSTLANHGQPTLSSDASLDDTAEASPINISYMKNRRSTIAATGKLTAPPMDHLRPWYHDALEFHVHAPKPNRYTRLKEMLNLRREILQEGIFNLSDDPFALNDYKKSLREIASPFAPSSLIPHNCAACSGYGEHQDQSTRVATPKLTLRDDPVGILNLTNIIGDCLQEREMMRRVALAKEQGKEELAILYLCLMDWNSNHALGLLELLDSMEDGGAILVKHYYEMLAQAITKGDARRQFAVLEYISMDLPRQLLQVTYPDTAKAARARRWLKDTQEYKRLRALLGLPSLNAGDLFVFFYNVPIPDRGESAAKRLERQNKLDIGYKTRSWHHDVWNRLSGYDSTWGLQLYAVDEIAASHGMDTGDLYHALRGFEIARDSQEMGEMAIAHPELFNYESFLTLGMLVEEYNEDWALAAWNPRETAQSFTGFRDLEITP